jgi:hypothetical protein
VSPISKNERLWQWLQGTGLERCCLFAGPASWALQGTILTISEGEPAEVHYSVLCDSMWRTNEVELTLARAGRTRSLNIKAESLRWYVNGIEDENLRGCVDIDLSWSPSTNTLPIRRLNLAVGERSGTLNAAWVRFPEMELQVLPQEYERLSERSYRYSSGAGAFTAELEVDERGLVRTYEGLWQTVDG